MTQPCTMDPAHSLGLEAYRDADRGGAPEEREDFTAREQRAQDAFGLAGFFDDGAPPEPMPPARPQRPEPLDAKLAELAQRLRHDATDLRERACRLPLGRRRHRLFTAAVNADWAAIEIEALPEAAEIDAGNALPLAATFPLRMHRHG